MCGIFGVIGPVHQQVDALKTLAKHAEERGKDASGLILESAGSYRIFRSTEPASRLVNKATSWESNLVVGHSRLITSGLQENQPIVDSGVLVFHNGIITNTEDLWRELGRKPRTSIDTEIIPAIISSRLRDGESLAEACRNLLSRVTGVANVVALVPAIGELAIFSNNGSLFIGAVGEAQILHSERYPLEQLGASQIDEIRTPTVFSIPPSTDLRFSELNAKKQQGNLIPAIPLINAELAAMFSHKPRPLVRCSKCILPSTMPFIDFDHDGTCNYCANYSMHEPKPIEELRRATTGLRMRGGRNAIFPFSGGRDSSYGLHLAVNELGLRPIAFTYDWGMVTDLGRRNISRMCSALGVENIIVAADIEKKRKNIKKNLEAWLARPHLGMVNLLMAGDKHFFQHLIRLQKRTGISFNLWSFNPLETTHFKTGFLGVRPEFQSSRVYRTGLADQLTYQLRRGKEFLRNPGYFNSSVLDTLTGEYYRSVARHRDYYQLFDYFRWDENRVDDTLTDYNWERAHDTSSTWRIGDGTAAFYNYVFFRFAGFSEHDTFRSNQIREGQISREEALRLVDEENQPRIDNIGWYLDAVGLPLERVAERLQEIERKREMLPRL